VIGAAVRVHNGLTFPLFGSYDAYGHFTYVWYLAQTGRVPLPTSGWEFFHPPLYYALMALIWKALAGIDPVVRLRVGVVIVAVASLVHWAAVSDILRRRLPAERLVRLLAGGFMLFLPVHLYSAAFLGNEGLGAVLCTSAFVTLLAGLRQPTWTRSALLGLLLGLAMLTKVTALAAVCGCLGTIVTKGLWQRRVREEGLHFAVTAAVLLATCGWYYARNVEHYGTPLVMSRNELVLRIVESEQPQARRSLAEYLLFDPMIFRRPAWPRVIADDTDADTWSRAMRDSVWTGLYANTWFDGFGGWVVPRVTDSEVARRAGQALLVLGIFPTLLVLAGGLSAVRKLRRDGWDDLLVSTLLTLGAMLTIFVVGTRAVPIAAAVKATYLIPVTVPFGVLFALGLKWLRERRPALLPIAAVEMLVLAAISVSVFWYGLLFDAASIRGGFPMAEASERNHYGVVYYAGGVHDAARENFEAAAAQGLYLGWENLALLALEEGRPREALRLLGRAAHLQPQQSFGRPADRAEYDRVTRAEYANLRAVMLSALGRSARALRAAAAAVKLDPKIPEGWYDLAVLTLERETAASAAEIAGTSTVREQLERALGLDPGFAEARQLLAGIASASRDCSAPVPRSAASPARIYPVETGPGASYAASIARRQHIRELPQSLRSRTARQNCGF